MKKLLLALLLIPSISYADSVTSGSVGFLKPSTGVYSSRSWADVLNANWDIAAALITAALANNQNLIFSTNVANNQIMGNNIAAGTIGIATQTNIQSSTITVYNATFVSSVTFSSPTYSIGGQRYVWQSTAPVNTDQILHIRNGANVYWGGDGGGGAAASGGTENTTNTYRLRYPSYIINSTQSLCRVTCMSVGHSTLNVVSISAYLVRGSTAASTWAQIVESTGGVNALPFKVYGSRFPVIIITTATSDNYSAYSEFITTGVTVNAGSWLGVAIASTSVIGGNASEGIEIHINAWKKPYGSTD